METEREAFFDTRVSGNDEVWKGLSLVADMVRNGNVTEAQVILDAMNITCPTGRIASGRGRDRQKGGLYDERGELYDIPSWVLIDPEDIVEDEKKDAVDGAADEAEESTAAAALRREEKGKGRAEDPGETVELRARLSDRGTDVTVSVGTKQRLSLAIRKIQEQVGNKRIRLMYLGKTLNEQSTLEQSTWQRGHVVNALVYEGDEKVIAQQLAK